MVFSDSRAPLQVSVAVGKQSGVSVQSLRAGVAAKCGLDPRALVFCVVEANKIRLKGDDSIFNYYEDVTAFQVELPEGKELRHCHVLSVLHMNNNSGYYGNKFCGRPRVLALPKAGASNAWVREKVLELVNSCQMPGMPDPTLTLVDPSFGNCKIHGYLSSCRGCPVPNNNTDFECYAGYSGLDTAIGLQWAEGAYEEPDIQVQVQAEARSSGGLTVRECLRAFSLPEVLSPDNEWYCRDCKQHKRATKMLSVYSLPDLLIIHLKRFHYQGEIREKIETQVGFPLDGLDLSEFCQKHAGAAAQEQNNEGKVEPMLYDCYGVSNHMGGMGGGHYNAYVRNLATGDW